MPPARRLSPVALLLVALCAGCGPVVVGSGNVVTEKRAVGGFHAVSASTSVEVTVTVGSAESVEVEADDNILPLVKTAVAGGELDVTLTGSCRMTNPVRVKVTAKSIDGLSAGSSAKVTADGPVTGDELRLTASSSGRVAAADVEVKALTVGVSSSGTVTAAGKAASQTVEASSSGSYHGEKLDSRTATVSASSSGSASVKVSESLTGEASSSGRVRYFGKPGRVAVETSSSGSVSPGE